MKKRMKTVAVLLAVVLLLPAFGGIQTKAEEKEKQVDVIFTHDTHSHLNSFSTVENGEDMVLGGFSRIKTLINEQLAKNPDTLILDGGDFSMGTLVQTVYETEAAEIRMLGELGCDVTTLGNHEFDYRSKGLANMLTTAADSGDELPALVLCNVDWDTMEAAGLNEGQQQIKEAFEAYGVSDYVVITKGDVDIAVFGVFGEDSLACAPTCELLFKDPVESAKETVEEIKTNEDVDMIVCVSHSGTNEDESKSEDENIAKAAPDIDLIVSGHTHTELNEPIRHGDTYIVSCGEYGKKLGSVSLVETGEGVWSVVSYGLTPVTQDIDPDITTQDKIDTFLESVNTEYLSRFGYTKDQVLATNDIEFATVKDLETIHEEQNLGSLMADAYIYAVEGAEDFNGDPVDVAVVPSGTVRDTYTKGDITVEDVFNSFSLGIGEDGIPGYPLVETYLTGKELKVLAEIDASVSDFMPAARLYMSGLNFTHNPNRLILNKVTDCYLIDRDGNRIEIEDDRLYHVVADLYSAQMLGAVTDVSYGILSLVPKYADGTPVEDFADIILTENGKEIKAWDAIAEYIGSFEDTDGDGIGNVPEIYAANRGRKIVDDSKNIINLLKNPNRYAFMIVGVIVVLILLVIFIIVLIKKLVRRRRTK